MAFVNEEVSPADIEKYGLRDINQQYHPCLRDVSCRWTIDRERDIYVRKMGTGREETCSHTTFTFYWKGHLFFWVLDYLGSEKRGEDRIIIWGLAPNDRLSSPLTLPSKFASVREEIVKDFKEAITAAEAADFVISPIPPYRVEFKF